MFDLLYSQTQQLLTSFTAEDKKLKEDELSEEICVFLKMNGRTCLGARVGAARTLIATSRDFAWLRFPDPATSMSVCFINQTQLGFCG